MFRAKYMTLAEWAAFQDRYEKLFVEILKGDPQSALFLEHVDGFAEKQLVLIPAVRTDLIEALAPGDWFDCVDYNDRRWSLLVGNSDARETFGLKGANG